MLINRECSIKESILIQWEYFNVYHESLCTSDVLLIQIQKIARQWQQATHQPVERQLSIVPIGDRNRQVITSEVRNTLLSLMKDLWVQGCKLTLQVKNRADCHSLLNMEDASPDELPNEEKETYQIFPDADIYFQHDVDRIFGVKSKLAELFKVQLEYLFSANSGNWPEVGKGEEDRYCLKAKEQQTLPEGGNIKEGMYYIGAHPKTGQYDIWHFGAPLLRGEAFDQMDRIKIVEVTQLLTGKREILKYHFDSSLLSYKCSLGSYKSSLLSYEIYLAQSLHGEGRQCGIVVPPRRMVCFIPPSSPTKKHFGYLRAHYEMTYSAVLKQCNATCQEVLGDMWQLLQGMRLLWQKDLVHMSLQPDHILVNKGENSEKIRRVDIADLSNVWKCNKQGNKWEWNGSEGDQTRPFLHLLSLPYYTLDDIEELNTYLNCQESYEHILLSFFLAHLGNVFTMGLIFWELLAHKSPLPVEEKVEEKIVSFSREEDFELLTHLPEFIQKAYPQDPILNHPDLAALILSMLHREWEKRPDIQEVYTKFNAFLLDEAPEYHQSIENCL